VELYLHPLYDFVVCARENFYRVPYISVEVVVLEGQLQTGGICVSQLALLTNCKWFRALRCLHVAKVLSYKFLVMMYVVFFCALVGC
jgi:hypothetical protein